MKAPSGHYGIKVGDIAVTAINDGNFHAGYDLISGLPTDDCAALERRAYRRVPPLMTMNAFLLRMKDGGLTLIDTGCGTSMGPTLGHLPATLKALGIDADAIGTILLTHLHPDHANGLIDEAGRPLYRNAELVVHERELDFMLDDASLARAPAETHEFFPQARAAIAPYRDRIRTVREGPVASGISAVPHPGHTPGHTGWLIDSQGEQLLIWGDIVHMPGVQLPAPQAGTVLDIDPAQAVQTRRRVLDMAASDGLRVSGVHLDFPAFGHIEKAGEGYRFIADMWSSLPVDG